jgi:branched-chain amino acid transport system ATP-binding protein
MTRMLHVDGLNKRFGGLTVTSNVSLHLDRGDRMALIGPNGAGKTTFVNLVTGHLRPDSGEVCLDGENITRRGPTTRVKAGLVRTFQVTRLFLDMSAREHVALALLQRDGHWSRMFGHHRTMPQISEETDAILTMLELDAIADIKAGEVAYGQQRLIEIAIAVALRPKVLLLDEPAAGVSHGDIHLIERAMQQLPDDLAILMIEHDMDLVFRFATRIVVLAAGAVIFDGSPDAVRNDLRVRKAYLGSYADDRSNA